ncbi:hypothetical protein BC828DRAFT_408940 [Blastocladiella britannica]|nr:hypothetical protein BC828DRAFT_408940 [Blastocladiella britannica]
MTKAQMQPMSLLDKIKELKAWSTTLAADPWGAYPALPNPYLSAWISDTQHAADLTPGAQLVLRVMDGYNRKDAPRIVNTAAGPTSTPSVPPLTYLIDELSKQALRTAFSGGEVTRPQLEQFLDAMHSHPLLADMMALRNWARTLPPVTYVHTLGNPHLVIQRVADQLAMFVEGDQHGAELLDLLYALLAGAHLLKRSELANTRWFTDMCHDVLQRTSKFAFTHVWRWALKDSHLPQDLITAAEPAARLFWPEFSAP